MRRGIDIANVSINFSTLLALLGLVVAVVMAYAKIVERLDVNDSRLGDMQSQVGETNERLTKLEGK